MRAITPGSRAGWAVGRGVSAPYLLAHEAFAHTLARSQTGPHCLLAKPRHAPRRRVSRKPLLLLRRSSCCFRLWPPAFTTSCFFVVETRPLALAGGLDSRFFLFFCSAGFGALVSLAASLVSNARCLICIARTIIISLLSAIAFLCHLSLAPQMLPALADSFAVRSNFLLSALRVPPCRLQVLRPDALVPP
jgi:hypothetical protein